jgi:uncharacterized protein YecE (DUF72 family)
MLLIGCCGYTVAKTKYHERLAVIELTQTFFQPPSPRVLSGWRQSAPEGFEFIARAWQLITHDPMSPTYKKLREPVPDFKHTSYGHFRPTPEVWRAWDVTERAARALGAKIIVFQTPPNNRPSEENAANIRAFFSRIAGTGYTLVWDPRGWKPGDARPLCEELGLVYACDPLRPEEAGRAPSKDGITYLRLPGRGGFRYNYTDEELREVARRFTGSGDVYVIFDNSYMFDNALRLKELTEGA